MRTLFALTSVALLITGCWGPVEQTSPQPFTAIPAHARGKAVKAMCKSVEKTDNYLCNGVAELDEKKAEHGEGGHH